MSTKVSIIIPYWKGPAYLKDCIKSLSRQGISDYEAIIVRDNGGDEISGDVLNDSHVVVYNAAEEYGERKSADTPLGVAVCRNIGIGKAAGDYVYFVDSDDYLLDHALYALLELVQEKKAMLATGSRLSSWFGLSNVCFDRLETAMLMEGVQPLEGDGLKKRFGEMFSAQHLLIERKFLLESHILFDTDMVYYSDIHFVARILKEAGEQAWMDGNSIYVWRHHNDRIHLPALSQTVTPESSEEYLEAYKRAADEISEKDKPLRQALDTAFIRYTLKRFPGIITPQTMKRYGSVLRSMENRKKLLGNFSFMERKKLFFIRRGSFCLAKLSHNINLVLKKKGGKFGNKIQWYRVLEHLIFNRLPVKKNWILFESFFGKNYSDSPKYLYEYLQRTRGKKYRYIWIVNEESPELKQSGRHKSCKMNSLRYVYYMARCGYRIFNVRQPGWNRKREGVVFLETWHGTPLKKLGFDMEDLYSANQNLKQVFYYQGKEWNYLVSANRFSTDVFERAFEYDRNQILEYGYPRNDVLYAENKNEIAAEVKRELGIPEGKRVILYAPTWRDKQYYESNKNDYQFSLAIDFKRLQEEFGRDSVILLRTHYYVAKVLDLSEYEGFVYSGIDYEDVSRLYLASDICITDYSSVFFDYANLRRPLLFFVYDYEEYADEVRGLYIDMEKELPGPILKTNDELIEALRDIAVVEEKYSERYEDFYNRFCNVDDGHASERIIEKVFGERESK